MAALLAKSGSKLQGLQVGQKVEGVVVEIGNKTLILEIGAKSDGIVAEREFEAAQDYIRALKVGDKVTAVVVTPETKSGQVMLSLRDQAEENAWKRFEEAKKNDIEIDVRVQSVTRGGLAVDALGISGFIPTSQLGKNVVQNMQSQEGRTLQVKVVEIDKEGNRIVLSEKAVSEAEDIENQQKAINSIKPGEEFTGKVVGVVPFGAFVRIEKDGVELEGLVHLSEISWIKVADSSSVLTEGQSVQVKVMSPNSRGEAGNGKLALSIKQTLEDPWTKIADKYKAETKISGKVIKMTENGAYVELEPGVDGLLRTAKIPADMSVKEGDSVDCFVEEVDIKNHKISLGLALKAKPMGYK